MNDVNELKEFAILHARSQNIARPRDLLGRIRTDAEGPGSWAGEWSAEAERHARHGRYLMAARHFNMARFPYVNGPARQDALDRCVDAFGKWRIDKTAIERLDIELADGRVGCWTAGLSATDRLPLVLVIGGIVSVKEQWAPLLEAIRRSGTAAIATEMPGVGENTLRYTADSWRMLSGILDAVRDRADVDRTYALALSFSGHLAMRCALDDGRIRGVVTAGAPVRAFFTDRAWLSAIPHLTRDTLIHLVQCGTEGRVPDLGAWAMTESQLAALEVPVYYMVSRRDEIVPGSEARLLRQHVRDLHLLEHDDVHGSPRHVAESRLWIARSVLRMQDRLPVQRAALGAALAALRLTRHERSQ
ncbi:MAG: alpha/beta fold hydrolase [Trebonia sp.]